MDPSLSVPPSTRQTSDPVLSPTFHSDGDDGLSQSFVHAEEDEFVMISPVKSKPATNTSHSTTTSSDTSSTMSAVAPPSFHDSSEFPHLSSAVDASWLLADSQVLLPVHIHEQHAAVQSKWTQTNHNIQQVLQQTDAKTDEEESVMPIIHSSSPASDLPAAALVDTPSLINNDNNHNINTAPLLASQLIQSSLIVSSDSQVHLELSPSPVLVADYSSVSPPSVQPDTPSSPPRPAQNIVKQVTSPDWQQATKKPARHTTKATSNNDSILSSNVYSFLESSMLVDNTSNDLNESWSETSQLAPNNHVDEQMSPLSSSDLSSSSLSSSTSSTVVVESKEDMKEEVVSVPTKSTNKTPTLKQRKVKKDKNVEKAAQPAPVAVETTKAPPTPVIVDHPAVSSSCSEPAQPVVESSSTSAADSTTSASSNSSFPINCQRIPSSHFHASPPSSSSSCCSSNSSSCPLPFPCVWIRRITIAVGALVVWGMISWGMGGDIKSNINIKP